MVELLSARACRYAGGMALMLVLCPLAIPQQKDGMSFDVLFPDYKYERPVHSVGEVDFRNFTAHFFESNSKISYSAKLSNGLSRERSEFGRDWVALSALHYFGFDEKPSIAEGGEAAYALAVYLWVSGGASASGYGIVQVYRVRENKLVVVQQIRFDAKTQDTGASFNVATKTLTLTASHYALGDAHCCPSKQDIIIFQWSRGRFKETSSRTMPRAQ